MSSKTIHRQFYSKLSTQFFGGLSIHKKVTQITYRNNIILTKVSSNTKLNDPSQTTIQHRLLTQSVSQLFKPSTTYSNLPFSRPHRDEEISHAYIKFINQDGKSEGIKPLKQVLKSFDREIYWLIEVGRDENPPICKLIEKKVIAEKEKEQRNKLKKRSHPTVTKELQLTWKVDDHDLVYKISKTKEWLIKGYHVTIVISNRGVKRARRSQDKTILDKIFNELKDYSKEIKEPMFETGGSVLLKFEGKGVNIEKENAEPVREITKEKSQGHHVG